MAKILIITNELTPLPEIPCGGLGYRIFNLGEGLKKNGHIIEYSFFKTYLEKLDPDIVSPYMKLSHDGHNYDKIIEETKPDIILFSNWFPAVTCNLKDKDIPVIIDIPGPLILENYFETPNQLDEIITKKITALSKADIILCSNPRQKYYLLPWLLLSGFENIDRSIFVVPISAPRETPKHTKYPVPIELIFAGVLWKWQDYGNTLKTTAEFLNKNGGKLKTFCGGFQYSDENRSLSGLKNYASVENHDIIPYGKLINEYLKSSAAIDLYMPNCERKLALTTRTIQYLWCGLPVIYSKDMYLSDFIEKYDAGWVINPDSETELLNILKKINDEPEICRIKGKNAQKLIIEQFNNKNAAEKLSDYCSNPFKSIKKENIILNNSSLLISHAETILSQTKTINLQTEEITQKQKMIDSLSAELNEVKTENIYLKEDLNRITSRLIFKILLKIKKLFS